MLVPFFSALEDTAFLAGDLVPLVALFLELDLFSDLLIACEVGLTASFSDDFDEVRFARLDVDKVLSIDPFENESIESII